jgi:phage tail sheath protein FI
MPEYLAPGVYVEEVSFRSKSIEGVATSTAGFAGMTRTGPVRFANGPLSTEPRLITSFADFERTYGGLQRLTVDAGNGQMEDRESYLAHAVRAFFMNGGQRVYISRVFVPRQDAAGHIISDGLARLGVSSGGVSATWTARWPGAYGKVWLEALPVRSGNLAYNDANFGVQAGRVRTGSIVEILAGGGTLPTINDPVQEANLYEVRIESDGHQSFTKGGAPQPLPANPVIRLVEVRVRVAAPDDRLDVYDELSMHPDHKRYIGRILQAENPEDENAIVYLVRPASTDANANIKLLLALTGSTQKVLAGGDDGMLVSPDDLAGLEANPDVANEKATGLAALGEIDDIAIVALPDGSTFDDPVFCAQAADRLITHASNLRYRIAVVDGPAESSITQIRAFRGQFDSTYGALYYPWIEILDPLERPTQGAPPRRIQLPPSGFVTGIYARSDIQRGVHKAPANEVVRGLTKFEMNVNKGRQDVLNPEGINALRFFEGRGNRVWGARTMTSDPEWKYVNVRRLFIYLEHSIDKGTQWAVFEPNNQRLWDNIRQTIEDFLFVMWKDGALLGSKPEEAYFVRCDRTTMTQNDLDNGRLICLVGIAPVKPAEYVIFRVGQWTGDAKRN